MPSASCWQFVVHMRYIAYVLIVDYNGECDSKQDADNLPSWLNGTIIWQFLFFGFFLILLYISTQITCIPSACGSPASNPHKYAADPQSTQVGFYCMCFIIRLAGIICYTLIFKINCENIFLLDIVLSLHNKWSI